MDGATGTDETSTVNGYVMVHSGSPGAATAMGGPARSFNGSSDKFKMNSNANFAGQSGIPVSKFVAFNASALTGLQIIYSCTNFGTAPAWLFLLNGTTLSVVPGDAGGSADPIVVATGLSTGVDYGVGFSINRASSRIRTFFQGAFVNDTLITGFFPGPGSLFGNLGGDDLGRFFKGVIVAPTGWTRTLSDAEQALMWNGGTPWRLT